LFSEKVAVTNHVPDKTEIRQRMEELVVLNKELEKYNRQQANAANIVAAEQFKKQVNELTESLHRKMGELVAMHPDAAARERFAKLQSQVEGAEERVNATKSIAERKELNEVLQRDISDWIHHFQTMMAELMGAPPPPGPVFS
jgi:hypothetical protein